MKLLIITMGPGETSQGAALGRQAIRDKHDVTFGVILESNLHFLDGFTGNDKLLLSNGDKIKREIKSGGYDAVVFCNSKTLGKDKEFQTVPPKTKPLVVSLDSNWLFNQPEQFPYISWLDKIYLNFPQDVYENGLNGGGGQYSIPSNISKKILPIGLIPSYRPLEEPEKTEVRNRLGIQSGQKLVFTYIGSSVTYRKDFYQKYLLVFDALYDQFPEIRVVFLSGDEPDRPWIIKTGGQASSDNFYKFLASADLVFQHQGLGTLEQAISAQVPVIANVSRPVKHETTHTHAWEVEPFVRAGLCKIHFYDDPEKEIIDSIGLLLTPNSRLDMVDAQKAHYSVGEQAMLLDIVEMIERKK